MAKKKKKRGAKKKASKKRVVKKKKASKKRVVKKKKASKKRAVKKKKASKKKKAVKKKTKKKTSKKKKPIKKNTRKKSAKKSKKTQAPSENLFTAQKEGIPTPSLFRPTGSQETFNETDDILDDTESLAELEKEEEKISWENDFDIDNNDDDEAWTLEGEDSLGLDKEEETKEEEE